MKKRTLAKILGILCVGLVFAGCAEYTDGGPGPWNYVCLILSGLTGWASKKLEGAR